MKMEISDAKAEQFDKLETTAAQKLQDYFDGKLAGGDEVTVAKTVLGIMKGNRQTATNREGLRFAMIESLGDENVRRKYIQSTQPEIKRLLPGSRKKS